VSERRGVDVRRLGQVLRGELDWLVMKALEKDRNRRYESTSALAADVQRYLRDEPVEACPPSAGYRLRKFARRHQRPLAMAAVVLAALAAAVVVSAWQAVEARDAQHQAEADRKQAEADRDRAQSAERQAKTEQDRAQTAERRAATEAAIARAVNAFLQQDLLGQADGEHPAIWAKGEKPYLTVRDALDQASARIDQRFHDQPLVEAAIRTTLGVTYHRLRDVRTAIRHLKRAVDLRQAHLGSDHPDTGDSIAHLAHAYQWATRFPEAIALRRGVLERVKAQFGADHPDTLGCMVALAETLECAGQLDESALLLEHVVEKQRARSGTTHPDTYDTMYRLACTYGHNNKFDESRSLFEKLLTLRRSDRDLGHFGEFCIMAGKPARAEPLLRECLQLRRQQKQSLAQQNSLATTLGLLGLSQFLQGQYDEAESLLREALAIDQLDVRRHYQWVSVQGAVLLGRKKYAEAEPLLLEGYRGLKKDEALHPAVGRRLAQVGGWIVRLYEATNQPDKALQWREKVAKYAKACTPNRAVTQPELAPLPREIP
jgi:tetratricopeptide (TPR) repeat protein